MCREQRQSLRQPFFRLAPQRTCRLRHRGKHLQHHIRILRRVLPPCRHSIHHNPPPPPPPSVFSADPNPCTAASRSPTCPSRSPPGQSWIFGSRGNSVSPYFAWRIRVSPTSRATTVFSSRCTSFGSVCTASLSYSAASPVITRRSISETVNSTFSPANRSHSAIFRVDGATRIPHSPISAFPPRSA